MCIGSLKAAGDQPAGPEIPMGTCTLSDQTTVRCPCLSAHHWNICISKHQGPRAFYTLGGGGSFAHSFQGILKDDPVHAAADSNPSLLPQPRKHAPTDVLSSVSLLVLTQLPMVQAADLGSLGWGMNSESLLGTAPKAELEHCLRIARTFYFGS